MKFRLPLFFLIGALFATATNAQILDPTFGDGGVLIVDADGGEEDVEGFVIQNDGKLLVMGDSYTDGDGDFYVIRIEPNGTMDIDFGDDGLVNQLFSDELNDSAEDAVHLDNGKIMVLGKMINNTYLTPVLVRLNDDGTLDETFQDIGYHLYPVFSEITSYPQNLLQLSNEEYMMTGRIGDFGFADIFLIKTDADGELDMLFGDGGYTSSNVLGSFDTIDASLLLSDDAVIGAGWSFDPNVESDRLVIIKFTPNGNIDTSFGQNGVIVGADSGGQDAYKAMAKYGEDHFLATGYISPDGGRDIIISRFDFSGNPDLSFGISGHVILDHTELEDVGVGVAELWDGSIIVAARSESDNGENKNFALIKLNQDGTLDTDFGDSGWFIHDETNADVAERLIIQPDGKALLAGTVSNNDGDGDIMVIRVTGLTPTGIDDDLLPSNFNLAPNPARSVLRISGDDQLAEIAVISSDGQVIQLCGVKRLPTEIDISALATGQYFLRIGEISKRFVKID